MARVMTGSKRKGAIKALVFGDYGTQKSGFAVDIAKMKREDSKPMRVLYIDTEGGGIDQFHLDRLEDEGVDIANIFIVYTSNYSEVKYYCDKVNNNEFFYNLDEDGEEIEEDNEMILDADGKPFVPDAVVIDSISVISDSVSFAMAEFSEQRAKVRSNLKQLSALETRVAVEGAGVELKDWSKIKKLSTSLTRSLITENGKHVIFVSRSKQEKVMKKNGGKMDLVATGKEVMDCWQFLSYEVSTVVRNFIDEESGEVFGEITSKDRTGVFKRGEIIENPSITLWQPVLDRNKGRKESVVMTQTSVRDSIEKDKTVLADDSPKTDKVEKDPKKLIQAIKQQTDEMSTIKKKRFQTKFKELGINPTKIKDETLTLEEAQKIQEVIDLL